LLEPIQQNINNLNDIINLTYTYDKNKKYIINMDILIKLRNPLLKLQNMIGMDNVKNSILDLILYNLQNFEDGNSTMLHTVIEGNPGTGKTEVAKIIAEIYFSKKK